MKLNRLFMWFTLMGLLQMHIEGISVAHLKDIETYPDPTKPTTTAAVPDPMPVSCYVCDSRVDENCAENPTKRTICYPRDGKENCCINVFMRAENITIRGCEIEVKGDTINYCTVNVFCSVCFTDNGNSRRKPAHKGFIAAPVPHKNSAPLMRGALIILAICIISSLAKV